jgi:peptide/nickel transport system substrate-binding protein
MSRNLLVAVIVVIIIVAAIAAYHFAYLAQPRKVVALVIGVTDKVTDIDPSNAYDFFTWEVLSNIMEGLVKYKPGTDQIIPAIAESWTVGDGGKAWVFRKVL